jgi:putative endonuclease
MSELSKMKKEEEKYNIRKTKGKIAEDIACQYLENKGYKIIKRNFRTRYGEIDIIALSPSNVLCFVEVKSAEKNSKHPEESINQRKISKILKNAEIFISQNKEFSQLETRFDVITIKNSEINHIEDAFSESDL